MGGLDAAACWYAKHTEAGARFAQNIAETYSPNAA